ncbi:kinesin-domain-containing protein [Dacryopinax primogenitus]|uniref:Kinesin-like protein n=1 Tax=Dacryopinax primogenitus (strain DJM 731) TaxID=1858805 RepID=M5FSI5_DACPD|nr:kinesin-domain-containing protein [Dacryopinax primogenitus]EJT98848.1 kinesin-domain-containing protein [Dacryopinax primogenitus]
MSHTRKASASKAPSTTRSETPSERPVSPSKITAAITAGVKLAKKNPAFRRAMAPQTPQVSRPTTPSSPLRHDSPAALLFTPEKVTTVTSHDVDISADLDDAPMLDSEDKVLVSVRVRPNKAGDGDDIAWKVNEKDDSVQLRSEFARAGGAGTTEYHFDNIVIGSDNKSVYNVTAKAHVRAAMEGFNSVIFAYGQTASGKTFTLTGDEEQPGIIPRAMKDVFSYIRKHPKREFLLRASYLEIYNETIHDLLSPVPTPVQLKGTTLVPLREEVFTSPQGVKEILDRGDGNRRTASTDWNERSSRSHSIFRLVVESRELASDASTPNPGVPPPTPGGSRLYDGGKPVQMSVLNLIDLAGSEKATSDKERTREGRYINTSLLTLGHVIQILGENAAKEKSDHVPYRSSKLTHMLQPCLSGDARISVICTINASPSAITETQSTLGFASRIKKVHLNAEKKELIDTEALIERYKAEIRALKNQLEEREREAPSRHRRLSLRDQKDDSKAMTDISKRIKQLRGLILTSNTVDDGSSGPRPVSPSKVDFDLAPHQLREELFQAKRKLELQNMQILSLETALEQRPLISTDAPESDKDRLIAELQQEVRDLSVEVRGHERSSGDGAERADVQNEREWTERLRSMEASLAEKDAYATECAKALETEKQARARLEEANKAMHAFIRDIDLYITGKSMESRIAKPRVSGAGALGALDTNKTGDLRHSLIEQDSDKKGSALLKRIRGQPSLLEHMPEELEMLMNQDDDFEVVPQMKASVTGAKVSRENKENMIG